MFVDRVIIQLRAGKGGNGIVAWHREKFIPKGGPSGGNGGDGGSIIVQACHDIYSLEDFRNHSIIKADDGAQGGGGNRKGKRGEDLILKVPIGTLLKESDTNTLIYDFTQDGETIVLCVGGKGGKGNSTFKSATNRTPQQCTKGKEGEEKEVEFELKLIADVGLVGFPNAGKSTFLKTVTNVAVKIAPYPFTTLKPNLGYIYEEFGNRILIADIPGIIPGAHQNKGLGLEFLRHIERTEVLLFIIDISGSEGRNPCDDYKALRQELAAYNQELLSKPFLVALNKNDLEDAPIYLEEFRKTFSHECMAISSKTGEGMDLLIKNLKSKLTKQFI